MHGLLDYDGLLMRTINKIVDIVMLSLAWLLFSIPIITIGAATSALYYTAFKVVRKDRSHVWREFWASFLGGLKQTILLTIILILLYLGFGVVCYLYFMIGVLKFGIAVLIYVIVAFVLTMWGIYLFSYVARFRNTTKGVLMNAGYMCTKHIFTSILLGLILCVSILGVYLFPIIILVVPAGCAVLYSFLLERIFKRYMKLEDLQAECMKYEKK